MIVIPMAGMSSRFFKAGYDVPKYQLQAHGKSLFEWSVRSFEKYFETELFVFICRDVYDTPSFINSELKAIGIVNYEIIILDGETRGQAETVSIALDSDSVKDDERLLIFNIDTCRYGCSYPDEPWDAWLEVFLGEGEHWSFAKADPKTNRVIKTAEKVRISDLCSNGVYYFKSKQLFLEAYNKMKHDVESELYIAPMYNYIIDDGGCVGYKIVDLDSHVFMGTPQEYEEFLRATNV